MSSSNYFYKTIIFILIAISMQLSASAANLNINSIGCSQWINNTSLQYLNLDFDVEGDWKLVVSPNSQKFINTINQSKTLPLNRLVLKDINGNDISSLTPDKSIIIAQGNNNGHININNTLKVKCLESDYPGDYICDLRFTLITENSEIDRIYTLNFNHPLIQNIKSDDNHLNINIKGDDIFKTSASHYIKYPTNIYVSSNKEWSLNLSSPPADNLLNYYFKILSVPDNAFSDYDKEYTLLTDKIFKIVKGKPTVNNQQRGLNTGVIKINYMVKTPDDEIMSEGLLQRQIEYILDEDEG